MTRDLTQVGQVCVSRNTFVVCAQNYTKLSSSCPSSWPATTQEAVAMTSWPRASWFAIRTGCSTFESFATTNPCSAARQWRSTAGKDRAIWGARHKRRRNRTQNKMQRNLRFWGGACGSHCCLGFGLTTPWVRWVNQVCFSPTLRTIYPERHGTPECWMMMLDEISSAAPPREIVTPQSPAGFTISDSKHVKRTLVFLQSFWMFHRCLQRLLWSAFK
jgi:hypothetical protein